MKKERFVPAKRQAVDGRVWWCIIDRKTGKWSTYTCHGKYNTRKDAQYAIDKYCRAWTLPATI